MTDRPRVALLSRIIGQNGAALARITGSFEVAATLAEYERLRAQPGAWEAVLPTLDALVVGVQPVDRALLDRATRLRRVIRVGTGLDSVDVGYAAARGVRVTALPGMNAEAVAEFAFALLLAAAREIPAGDASVRRGEWRRFVGRQTAGRTLGLVGFGETARRMVPKAVGFGMQVLAHARRIPSDAPAGVEFAPLAEVVRRSQFLSLHVPLTDETRGLIGRAEIEAMDGVVLVNAARGGVVDEAALVDGLTSGRIAAAGLDVFDDEPPVGSPLLDLPNVVLAPHTAGHGDVTNAAIAQAIADGLLEALDSWQTTGS